MKRQGDILFEQVEARPPGRAGDPIRDGVIARGETTGHAHKLDGGTLLRVGRDLVIDVPDGGVVTHEEHDRIELEPGVWLVHQQQEYVGPGETADVYD